jgi:hypothetical protein
MIQIDILNIDSKIKQMFKEEEDKLCIYEEKLIDLEKTLEDGKKKLSSRIYKDLLDNVSDLKTKIEKIKSHKQLNFYLVESHVLLEKYKKILQTPVKLNFLGKKTIDNTEKNSIILDYLEISQKYINTDFELSKKDNENKVICNNCPNKKYFDVIDSSIYICLLCGSQQEILLHTSSYKDIDRINISVKYTYDRKVHFRDCINQYQGKQNSTIDNKVYKSLEKEFDKHYLLVGNKNTPREIRFANITKEHIHIFLKELNQSKHYENVNLIHYQITGIKPDDISYLEDKLLEDFDILTELYDKHFKNKVGFDRKNFINTQYVLYQFLLRYHHPCKKEDFTILKTVDRKTFHDDISKILFQDAGWNHFPMF